MSGTVLVLKEVFKRFEAAGAAPREVLRGVSIEVAAGRSLAIIGRSGAGKSTLLHLAAGIDVPTRGEVRVDGRDLASLGEGERTLLRRSTVGLVFQFFHLLPHLSVRDNVALPGLIAGDPRSALEARVSELLARVELGDRAGERVQKLSGGEMQRIALCRALLRRPRLLLADEPTGNLDEENGRRVMDLLFRLCREEGSTLVYVTHSLELARSADDVCRLHDGILETAV